MHVEISCFIRSEIINNRCISIVVIDFLKINLQIAKQNRLKTITGSRLWL